MPRWRLKMCPGPPHPGGQPATRGPHSRQARWPTREKGKSKSWLTKKLILIIICSSYSGVVGDARLVLVDGSTSCITNGLCKAQVGDGYACKVPFSVQDVSISNCEALNIHYNHWATEKIHIKIIPQHPPRAPRPQRPLSVY